MKKFFFILMMLSCSPKTEQQTQVVEQKTPEATHETTPSGAAMSNERKMAMLDDLTWILGKWQRTDATETYEVWQRADSAFVGKGYTIKNGKEEISETLQLAQRSDGIYYVATVASNPGPVAFRMVSLTALGATFENPQHDFPQRLFYPKSETDTMRVEISGPTKDGAVRQIPFPFVRVQ